MGQRYSHLKRRRTRRDHGHASPRGQRREIARVPARASSAIVRELRRNGHAPRTGGRGRPRLAYDATRAGERALLRHKPRWLRKLRARSALWLRVKRMLAWRWVEDTTSLGGLEGFRRTAANVDL